MKTTLTEQLKAFENNIFLDSNGETSWCYNFYDWFCSDKVLKSKATKLFNQTKKFLKANPQIDLNTHYVFFKNNCPMVGPLYDDFRICDIENGDVQYTVTNKCGHTGMAEIWGRSNNFKEAIKTGKNFSELLKNNFNN
jgi:hypothetical protein